MTAGGPFRTLEVGGTPYRYCSLAGAEEAAPGLARLPRSLKVLAENLLRHGDAGSAAKVAAGDGRPEIAFRPARILMQDFTGVPAIADLAAMRDAARAAGAPVERIDPRTPVDLVIDHSVTVDRFGSAGAFAGNVGLEFERNRERYEFLRWGQEAFGSLRVVPPGTGICHQVNLEHLAQVVWTEDGEGGRLAYPDTLVGTDSHTTMVNGLAVLGWGVGGIEAEAAMLGRPISMLVPEVVGVRLVGRMPEGAGATDLVLTVTRVLRELGVVGKFVEFFGSGVADLPLADRATLANMAPEYGATCGFFPVDGETLRYLELTGRDPERVALVEAYAQEQGLWLGPDAPEPAFSDTVEIDLAEVGPSLAGPKRPQDRVALADAPAAMAAAADMDAGPEAPVAGTDYALRNGDVVIAAITSCTNTSNPSAMVAAGLLARKAVARGLSRRPWVKTSLAPGSQVVTDYLDAAGLTAPLEALGFHLVGYGCTTCIGNSGPLDPAIEEAVRAADGLSLCAVLSGNRNFEGRIHPLVRANWLASPALVVAYAIAGTLRADLAREPLGADADGNDVFLRDVWPGNAEIADTIAAALRPEMFRARYAKVFEGPEEWRAIAAGGGATYEWKPASTYVRRPPFFDDSIPPEADGDIAGARALLVLGDSVTTDHISPAGAIAEDSPAGGWLRDRQVQPREFNSYGSRRGNHEVMIRGTFANIRIRNAIAPGTEGGVTRHMPGGETMPVFEAAERYRDEGVPLVVLAGREYGTGSSRDWAAKGTRLLGIRAVIAESFERIHRSNLAGMGVLPLELDGGVRVAGLGLDGTETFDILGLGGGPAPRAALTLAVRRADGREERLGLTCRIDTADEAEAFRNGGILPHVLAQMAGGGTA